MGSCVLRRRGRMGDAAKILALAETPQFKWFGMWEQPVIAKLRGMFETAGDQVPVLAVFGDDHSCDGNRTGGGAAGDAKYRRWIDKVARGIGTSEVVIAFEPDSLGLVDCLIPSRRERGGRHAPDDEDRERQGRRLPLWVERPGFSNGSCHGGPARVGAWWEERAIQLVERAKWWRRR